MSKTSPANFLASVGNLINFEPDWWYLLFFDMAYSRKKMAFTSQTKGKLHVHVTLLLVVTRLVRTLWLTWRRHRDWGEQTRSRTVCFADQVDLHVRQTRIGGNARCKCIASGICACTGALALVTLRNTCLCLHVTVNSGGAVRGAPRPVKRWLSRLRFHWITRFEL